MTIGSTPPDPTRPPEEPLTRAANLGYAAVAGQAGCFTLAIIIVALLIGIWLDARMGTRGPFTIGLLLMSIPLSLFLMVRIALGAVNKIKPPPQNITRHGTQDTEEENR
ncbi:MAG: AtpZ/AtpI family protein [Chloroflexi bacterium]|nr:AtpZ/AtpI family protein [Chloroflexota bacterium]